MDVAGLVLGVLAEVRQSVTSVRDRWRRYEEGPRRFAAVDRRVNHLHSLIDQIDDIINANPGVLPRATANTFEDTVADVQTTLVHTSDVVDDYCRRAFEGGSSGDRMQTASRTATRVFRARSLADTMHCIEQEAANADNKLQHLLVRLDHALASRSQTAELLDSGAQKADDVNRRVRAEHAETRWRNSQVAEAIIHESREEGANTRHRIVEGAEEVSRRNTAEAGEVIRQNREEAEVTRNAVYDAHALNLRWLLEHVGMISLFEWFKTFVFESFLAPAKDWLEAQMDWLRSRTSGSNPQSTASAINANSRTVYGAFNLP